MKFRPVVSFAGLGTDEPAANELAYNMIGISFWDKRLVKHSR